MNGLADEGDELARAARVEVDTNPWPLLSGIGGSDKRALTHVAMYLAAVG